MAPRKTEPKTARGLIAAGLVTIVATAAELTARDGWWKDSRGNPRKFGRDVAREEKYTGKDWLKAPEKYTFASLPGGTAPKWMNGWAHGALRNNSEVHYQTDRDWLAPVRAVPDMTPAQLNAAMDRELKRLAGAELTDRESDFYGYGPKAAESYIEYRRAQLGLPLTWDDVDGSERKAAA